MDLLMLLGSILEQNTGLFTFNDSLSLTIMGTGSGPKRMQGSASRSPSKMVGQKRNQCLDFTSKREVSFIKHFSCNKFFGNKNII